MMMMICPSTYAKASRRRSSSLYSLPRSSLSLRRAVRACTVVGLVLQHCPVTCAVLAAAAAVMFRGRPNSPQPPSSSQHPRAPSVPPRPGGHAFSETAPQPGGPGVPPPVLRYTYSSAPASPVGPGPGPLLYPGVARRPQSLAVQGTSAGNVKRTCIWS